MTDPLIHPSAQVHSSARLGSGTEVSPYAVIEEDVVIGKRCRVEAHAVIKRHTEMGDENRIFEGAVLGGVPQDLGYSGGRSRLRIGNQNTFREAVTIHRATSPGGETVIGDCNYFMVNAHVAHECVLENQITLVNNVALAGHVHVEDHAFVSAGVVIHQFCRVGRYSMIGGNAKITQDVLPFFITDGAPGRIRGLNRVGLRRGDFGEEEMRQLKQAYRILSKGGMKLAEKLKVMREMNADPVRHLVAFVDKSGRGFCGIDPQE